MPTPPVGQVIRDITYCLDAGDQVQLDLLYPTKAVTYPRPLVLWIHGGTWDSGSKKDAASKVYVQGLRQAGFIVAAMDYSLAPAKKFPAADQDLTCGIRFLREHAWKYDIDPDHIGAVGASSGGHLAQMLGVDDGSKEFIGHGHLHFSSDVQAVVSLWGVSDLTRKDLMPSDEKQLPSIFGKFSKWAAASPITYVRAGLPPFLLVHGRDDTDVPVSQSRRMYHALQADKVPSKLVVVDNGEHGLKPAGGQLSPSVSAVVSGMVKFLKTSFKNAKPPKS